MMQMDQRMPLHTARQQYAQYCEVHGQTGADVTEIQGMSPVCIMIKQQISD
jgi:hypothetical protein